MTHTTSRVDGVVVSVLGLLSLSALAASFASHAWNDLSQSAGPSAPDGVYNDDWISSSPESLWLGTPSFMSLVWQTTRSTLGMRPGAAM